MPACPLPRAKELEGIQEVRGREVCPRTRSEPRFQWSLGTVTITDCQLVEPKPVTETARREAARVKANAEKFAEAQKATTGGIIVIDNHTDDIARRGCWISCASRPAS